MLPASERILRDVKVILDAHYLGRDVELADVAMAKHANKTVTVL